MNTRRSAIFTAYNQIKKTDTTVDERKRTNKALGLAISCQHRPYHTSLQRCDCPDHNRHPEIDCKHIKRERILSQAKQGMNLLQLALFEQRKTWSSGECVWLWGNQQRGAYLRECGGVVQLYLTHCHINLNVYELDGTGSRWITKPELETAYQGWTILVKEYLASIK